MKTAAHNKDVKVLVTNRKARFKYHILENYEAGIVLLGSEIKSIREGKVNFKDSYARIKNGELFLCQMHVSHYSHSNIFSPDPERVRKLLMHKREIRRLTGKIEEQGLTLIPLELYLKNGKLKVLLALAKGKRLYNKKEAIARRDYERDKEREWKFRR